VTGGYRDTCGQAPRAIEWFQKPSCYKFATAAGQNSQREIELFPRKALFGLVTHSQNRHFLPERETSMP
jgi:hypothetical protein